MNLVRRAASNPMWQSAAGMSLSDFDRVLDQLYGGQPSWAGALVSQQTALAVSAVWACISCVADDIATLPTITYRRTKDGRERAMEHYLWDLMLLEVNPELSSWRFFQLMQSWKMLWGNAYAEIEINGRGQVVALWPWRPDRTRIQRSGPNHTGPIEYYYQMRNGKLSPPVPQSRMFHYRGMGIDGFTGLDPILVQRQNIGLSLAIQEHGARYFSNGARPLGIISVDHEMGELAYNRLKLDWSSKHQGLSNAHRVAILEEGATWSESGENMVDAAYIASQKMTQEDVCRFYKVPPHRVGILDKATNNNIEDQSLSYVLYTLGAECANWQNQIHCDLLSARENKNIYVAFDFTSLLRGNHQAMALFIGAMRDRGLMNADEIRETFLQLNPQPDGIGKEYYIAQNMGVVGDEEAGKPVNQQPMKKIGKPAERQNGNGTGNGNGNGTGKDNGSGSDANREGLLRDIQMLLSDPERCAAVLRQFVSLQ